MPKETPEERQRRLREDPSSHGSDAAREEHRRWVQRQMAIRDKANGPEEYHYTPHFSPYQMPFFVQQVQMLKAKGYY